MEDLPLKICHGKRELEAYYKYPNLNFEAKSSFSADNRIATEWIMSGTHTGNTARFKATSKIFSIPGVSILEIQDSKIVRETRLLGYTSLLQQLGLMPPMRYK